jgi:hypothetical protein
MYYERENSLSVIPANETRGNLYVVKIYGSKNFQEFSVKLHEKGLKFRSFRPCVKFQKSTIAALGTDGVQQCSGKTALYIKFLKTLL